MNMLLMWSWLAAVKKNISLYRRDDFYYVTSLGQKKKKKITLTFTPANLLSFVKLK